MKDTILFLHIAYLKHFSGPHTKNEKYVLCNLGRCPSFEILNERRQTVRKFVSKSSSELFTTYRSKDTGVSHSTWANHQGPSNDIMTCQHYIKTTYFANFFVNQHILPILSKITYFTYLKLTPHHSRPPKKYR